MKSILFSIAVLLFAVAVSAELNCECQKPVEFSNLVVGGKKANSDDYPWLVSFLTDDKNINFTVCHGVVLNENTILTAASCLPIDEEYDQVKIKYNGIEEPKSVHNVTFHPGFKASSDYSFVNDIALVHMKEKLNFTEAKTVKPACLATEHVKNYGQISAVGQGSTTAIEIDENGMARFYNPSKELKQAVLIDQTRRASACKDRKDTTICVHSKRREKDALCLGDVGTALEKENKHGQKIVVGIASLATHEIDEKTKIVKLCTSGATAARVSAYMPWIKETVKNEFCS